MSTYDELINTIKDVAERTGDPNGWQAGLTPEEVVAVITPTTPAARLDEIVRTIRRHHADLFGAAAPVAPPPEPGRGAAADAMAEAEAALAHQNSASSQLDMQVISAILNAHLKAVEGREELTRLQQETETAVLARSDLDTPAGARDFQRFLIGKLKDIRAVVLSASLDDTSKSALMAAWTSLYDASKSASDDRPVAAAAPVASPADQPAEQPVDDFGDFGGGWDPALDPMPADDPGTPTPDHPGQAPAPAAYPATPSLPPIPSFGTAPIPSLGGSGGLPLPGLQGLGAAGSGPRSGDDKGLPGHRDADRVHRDEKDDRGDDRTGSEPAASVAESPPVGPTTVALPDGDTVTAASPAVAAAIKAAVGGTPIAEAFQQQGITIPPPGTAVPDPIDPLRAIPGDLGMLTDRHALALGHEKALLDGQIQRIATVSGPTFLGWEHPPAPNAPATPPAQPRTPTPTGPAATSTA